MTRFAIHILYALTVAAMLCPGVVLADEENAPIESPQQALIRHLSEAVPINFEANRFVNVMDYLQNAAGLSISIDWPELEKWNVPKDTLVSLELHDTPAGRALELVLHDAAGRRLALLLHNGNTLHITMRRKAEHLVDSEPDHWSHWQATPRQVQDDEPSNHEVAAARMGKVKPWNFQENRIANIFDYLRHTTESSLYVDWNSIERGTVDQDSTFTGTGEFKPASEVLDTVLKGVSDDLAWRIDDFGIVIISTQDVIEYLAPAPGAGNEGKTDQP